MINKVAETAMVHKSEVAIPLCPRLELKDKAAQVIMRSHQCHSAFPLAHQPLPKFPSNLGIVLRVLI